MSHARLTHSDRPTLEFHQGQLDEDPTTAVANVAALIGVNQPVLVHTESRERERTITGRVTAPRRTANDGSTSDWLQALANYVDELESHVDEFQGISGTRTDGGYTLVDDQRNLNLDVIIESVEWRLAQGQPFEFEYDVTLKVGTGTFEARDVSFRTPTVNTGLSVAARVDGNDLPGLRQLTASTSVETQVNPLFDRTSAENNDIVVDEGPRHEFTIRGTHTGTAAARASADSTLNNLVATETPVTLETRFPGYDLDGYVLGYNSNLEARFGGSAHQYELRFIEADQL